MSAMPYTYVHQEPLESDVTNQTKTPGCDKTTERASNEGKAACVAGVEIRLCPYTPGSFMYKAWMRGYQAA